MVRSTLVYEGSKGTDDSRKTVRRQEVAMKGVGKEDTLKNLLPSYHIFRQIAILEKDGIQKCHVFLN